jgi:CBS-domain-containing membrane protein
MRRDLLLAPFAVLATLTVAFWLLGTIHASLIVASLGGSSVILFGTPENEMAQPRNFIGGHFLSSFVGLIYLHVLGDSHFVMAAATATAFALMLATRTVHSPAGSDPLIVISAKASWGFLLHPLGIGVLLLLVGAYAFHNCWRRMNSAEKQSQNFRSVGSPSRQSHSAIGSWAKFWRWTSKIIRGAR